MNRKASNVEEDGLQQQNIVVDSQCFYKRSLCELKDQTLKNIFTKIFLTIFNNLKKGVILSWSGSHLILEPSCQQWAQGPYAGWDTSPSQGIIHTELTHSFIQRGSLE